MIGRLVVLIVVLSTSLAWAESVVYVTDKVEIPVREDREIADNIIRTVPSGTKLLLLQATADGWSRVRVGNTTGWIVSRYTISNPTAEQQLTELKQSHDSAQLLINQLNQSKTQLETELQVLKIENSQLSVERNKAIAESKHMQKTYETSLALEDTNQRLQMEALQLKSEIKLLEGSGQNIDYVQNRNWFIVGAIVVCAGIFFGFLISFLSNRRRR